MNKENSDTYSVTCRCPRLLVFVLAAALVFGAVCVGGVSGADVWDGKYNIDWYSKDETQFIITTAEELAGLAKIVNGEINGVSDDFYGDTIVLGDNLLLNEDDVFEQAWVYSSTPSIDNLHSWTPIGSVKPFRGTFDGGGYYIGNLYSSFVSGDSCGLFGCVEGGTIKNVNLLEVLYLTSVSGNPKVTLGGLVAHLKGGVIKDCHVILQSKFGVTPNAKHNVIGGLAGKITDINGNSVDAEDVVGVYLQGTYSVAHIETTGSSRDGVISGSPNIDTNVISSDDLTQYAYYQVSIYEMDIYGEYGEAVSTITTVDKVGTLVSADYVVYEGFSLDTSIGKYEGTVTVDNSLVLSVYLKRNPIFKITIPDSLVISNETYEGGMRVGVEIQLIPRGSLSIYIHSLNNFKLVEKKSPHVTLPYSLYIGNTLTNKLLQDDEIARYGKRSTLLSTSIVLVGEMTGTPKYSGTYEDTLTFTVEYSDTN